MILDMNGREARAIVNMGVQYPADIAALCFLLNAWLHGPDCGVQYSRTLSGDIRGPFFAIRASRRGVQQRSA